MALPPTRAALKCLIASAATESGSSFHTHSEEGKWRWRSGRSGCRLLGGCPIVSVSALVELVEDVNGGASVVIRCTHSGQLQVTTLGPDDCPKGARGLSEGGSRGRERSQPVVTLEISMVCHPSLLRKMLPPPPPRKTRGLLYEFLATIFMVMVFTSEYSLRPLSPLRNSKH